MSVLSIREDGRCIYIHRKSRDGVMVSTSARNAVGPWFDSRLRSDRFLYVSFVCLFTFLHRASLYFSFNSPMQSIHKSNNK